MRYFPRRLGATTQGLKQRYVILQLLELRSGERELGRPEGFLSIEPDAQGRGAGAIADFVQALDLHCSFVVTGDRDFAKQLLERAADRAESSITFLDAVPADVRNHLLAGGGVGIRLPPPDAKGVREDTAFEEVLAARGGLLEKATAHIASWELCFPELRRLSQEEMRRLWASAEVRRAIEQVSKHPIRPHRSSTTTRSYPPVCRLVSARLSDGTILRFAFDTPWIERERGPLLDPAFIVLLIIATAILAYIVARIASAPLNHLSAAAAELGADLDRAPIAISGPSEVRRAAITAGASGPK